MLTALLWGGVAASSLIIGALAGVVRDWNARLIGLVLGFGAGALVASISFELAEEGFRVGGAVPVALGLAVGGIAFFLADMGVARIGGRGGAAAGLPLALGALPVARHGTPAQHERLLVPLMAGESIVTAAVSQTVSDGGTRYG